MAGTPDLAKVVSLIMENPKLIEEISALAGGRPEEVKDEAPPKEESVPTLAAQAPQTEPRSRKNRAELLCALKPYVSKERAQAIDSMITIVGILDSMKGR